jgi:tetratricopeptide (TPR) repeat protein
MAERAVEIDPDSPQTQWALGFVRMFRQEFEKAANAVERAVSLSPNYADGWGLLALINNQVGRGDQALRFIRKGMALNPRYSWDYPYNEGRAFHNMGEYEKAIEPLLLALERNENAWNPRLFLTSSYVRLDRIDDAEWEITQLEVQNPNLSIPYLQEVLPMSEGDHKDRFYEDMRRAGVPEE